MAWKPDIPMWTLNDLHRVLVAEPQPVQRLSANHYLVQSDTCTPMWCVINMAALDSHAEACVSFRHQLSCNHLRLIGEHCARETRRQLLETRLGDCPVRLYCD